MNSKLFLAVSTIALTTGFYGVSTGANAKDKKAAEAAAGKSAASVAVGTSTTASASSANSSSANASSISARTIPQVHRNEGTGLKGSWVCYTLFDEDNSSTMASYTLETSCYDSSTHLESGDMLGSTSSREIYNTLAARWLKQQEDAKEKQSIAAAASSAAPASSSSSSSSSSTTSSSSSSSNS